MTTMFCYNNRPPTLSLIPVIYNSLNQNKSKELELWLNDEYESDRTATKKSLRVQLIVTIKLETNQGLWNGGQQIRGLGNKNGKAPKTRVWGAQPQ